MDLGFFTAGLVTGLREGVEAALIVSIVLAYLTRSGNRRQFGRIWTGVTAAVVLSIAVGLVLFLTIGGLTEPAEQLFEGLAMTLAAAVVTWMLFWMRRQAASVRGSLHASVERALSEGSAWGLAILAFTAIIREGIETSLFLLGQTEAATRAAGGAASTLSGALLGMLVAAALGYGFYRGARVLNLRRFFAWTGVALIFIAAGLLSQAAHEFLEVATLNGASTPLATTAFDISGILPHEGNLLGELLRALFGYTSQPEWLTLVVWVAYVVIVLGMFLRPATPAPAVQRRPEEETRPA